MGETFQVRLEPVGIEFEVDEDETVLRGAFRQGLMLMHGCKEGQCAACKSFLLDGEVDLDKYSTFALNDFEKEEGWTLLCRAHAESDLEVELINYDEEVLRSGVALQTQSMRVETIEELTHDIRRLVLTGDDARPSSPASTSTSRSRAPRRSARSRWPICPATQLEFMIKIYPDGKFSSLLAEERLKPGRRGRGHRALRGVHPAGEIRAPAAVHRRRRGHGADPGAAAVDGREGQRAPGGLLLRRARARAISSTSRSWPSSSGSLPNFRFVPALSHCDEDADWDGERGLITDVVSRLEEELGEVDAYLCGPPPMVDAAIAMLDQGGVPESRVYYDKFTTTAP